MHTASAASVNAQLKWPDDVVIEGVVYTIAGEPNKDPAGLDVPNVLDGGLVDLATGSLVSIGLSPGDYTLSIEVQKPVSEERLRFSSTIFADHFHQLRFTVPEGAETVVLDDIWLDLK